MNAAAQVVVAIGVLALLVAIGVAVVRYARTIKLSVGNIQAEFRNNGGSSMRDAVDRLEGKVDGLVATVLDHEQRITALEAPKPKPTRPRTPRKKAA